jgi:hypothetical protein
VRILPDSILSSYSGVKDEYRNWEDQVHWIGNGFEGVSEKSMQPANAELFYPLIAFKESEIQGEFDPKINAFMGQFESVVYIAFGTQWMP